MSGSAPVSREDKFALVVDLGTGGPKIGFVSLTGKVAWQVHHLVETNFLPDGGAEQDAEEWWRLICDSARSAIAEGVVRPEAVVAVTITGQWSSTVSVDESGVPVAPSLLWMDSRGGALVRKKVGGPISGYTAKGILEFLRRSGGAPSLDGADPIGHRLFLQQERPEQWKRTRWLLEPVDYLSMRFSGKAAASPVSMTGSWLVDTRKPSTVAYDPVLVGMAGGALEKLPPLQRFGTVIGPILPAVAADLGLTNEVQIVTGCPDLHSGAIGSGAVRLGEAHMAVSTTGWICVPAPKKKTDIVRQVATVPGIDGINYLVANNHETAGMCLQWLRSVLGGDLDYDRLGELAGASAPGSGGVIFTPWLKGERSPIADRNARAGFHNMSMATTQGDLIRAVLEGVAYNNQWLHEAVEHFVGGRLDNIRFIGGGAQSDLWCQIHADVMDRTIEQVADPLYCGIRGAALIAAMALGEVKLDELRDLVEVRQTYRPNPANRAVYQRLYAEFPGLYSSQKKFFRKLNG